jgi:hypothetical protein
MGNSMGTLFPQGTHKLSFSVAASPEKSDTQTAKKLRPQTAAAPPNDPY